MQISNMTKGEWGKVRAFFDLKTEDGFTLKGFKLVEGSSGLFVGFPSKKNKDGEYNETISAGKMVDGKYKHGDLLEIGRYIKTPTSKNPKYIPFKMKVDKN